MGQVVNATFWLLYVWDTDSLPIVQEDEWAPEAAWMDMENLAPTGIRSPDLPAMQLDYIATHSYKVYYYRIT